jgi:hypothetical protein
MIFCEGHLFPDTRVMAPLFGPIIVQQLFYALVQECFLCEWRVFVYIYIYIWMGRCVNMCVSWFVLTRALDKLTLLATGFVGGKAKPESSPNTKHLS